MPKMLFTLACEQEDLFAAILKIPGVKLSVGVPEAPQERKRAPLQVEGPKRMTAPNYILHHMRAKPDAMHPISVINAAAQTEGITSANISNGMTKLTNEGVIERVGTGIYRLTKKPKKMKKQRKFDKTNREVITGMFAPNQPVTMTQITEEFKKDGRNPNSASPQLAQLKKDGVIEQIGNGTYQLTDKGQDHVATATA